MGWRSVPLSARELWLEQVNRAAELRGPFDPDCQRLFGRLLAIANEVSNELTLVARKKRAPPDAALNQSTICDRSERSH